jgi:hypothetical protein
MIISPTNCKADTAGRVSDLALSSLGFLSRCCVLTQSGAHCLLIALFLAFFQLSPQEQTVVANWLTRLQEENPTKFRAIVIQLFSSFFHVIENFRDSSGQPTMTTVAYGQADEEHGTVVLSPTDAPEVVGTAESTNVVNYSPTPDGCLIDESGNVACGNIKDAQLRNFLHGKCAAEIADCDEPFLDTYLTVCRRTLTEEDVSPEGLARHSEACGLFLDALRHVKDSPDGVIDVNFLRHLFAPTGESGYPSLFPKSLRREVCAIVPALSTDLFPSDPTAASCNVDTVCKAVRESILAVFGPSLKEAPNFGARVNSFVEKYEGEFRSGNFQYAGDGYVETAAQRALFCAIFKEFLLPIERVSMLFPVDCYNLGYNVSCSALPLFLVGYHQEPGVPCTKEIVDQRDNALNVLGRDVGDVDPGELIVGSPKYEFLSLLRNLAAIGFADNKEYVDPNNPAHRHLSCTLRERNVLEDYHA